MINHIKMKLVTNENNIDALKIVIAANEVKEKLDILPGSGLVPYLLENESDLKLFVVNQACLFLHENAQVLKKRAMGAVEGLLDWESKVLRPLLQIFHATRKNGEEIKAALKSRILPILDQSDGPLTNYAQHKDIVSANDIVIWCDLYPLWQDHPDIINAIPRVKTWMEYLGAKESFKSGLSTIFGTNLGKKVKWNFATWNKKANESVAVCCKKEDVGEVKHEKAEIDKAKKAWEEPFKPKTCPPKKGKILPQKDKRNVLITSALPYVNNVPHLGNIVGCVLSADVFARFCRLRGYNTLYVCGTDEYGTSTETKAIQEGLTPKQICDKYNQLHSEIYDWFEISFDKFGRTTTETQTKVAQDIFWELKNANMLIEDSMDQLYCDSCERFLADRFVEGHCPFCNFEDARGDQCDACGKLINAPELKNPRCKLCSKPPQVKSSKHIFIDLPQIEPELNKWLEQSSQAWTNNARVIAKSWLRGGLQPRCITRDLKWGTPVPLPGYESKVFYVWFDAPIGYISITAEYLGNDWQQWWRNPEQVHYYQFMAKDNVPFHSVVFPSTLLGTGSKWTMVNHLISTEYLNYEDAKFSKSRGIGVFGNDAQDTGIPADIWRFYLMYTRPESADSAFKWEDLMTKTNSELLANLGNFFNRAMKFTKDNYNGTIGKICLDDKDLELLASINQSLAEYVALLEKCNERDAIKQIFNISRVGNQLMQAEKPWKLVKSTDDKEKARAYSVVSLCANIGCLLAVLVEPYMPNLSRVMLEQLNAQLNDVNVLNQGDPILFRSVSFLTLNNSVFNFTSYLVK